jgi:hypothetical protein
LQIDAGAVATGFSVGACIAAGSTVLMVAGKRDALAVAAGLLAGAGGVTRSAVAVVGQRIDARAAAADLASGTGSLTGAAVLLVVAEVLAPAAALVETVLTLARGVSALGVVTTVSVSVAVLANLLTGRRGVTPASGQHCGDDAGDDGASWPRFSQRSRKGIKASFVHD